MKPKLTPELLHDYQKRAVVHQCTHPETMLFLDPGLGKTAVTLTSIHHLIAHQWLHAVLIVAPVRVCKLVWKQEALKWEHTSHLKFSMLTGEKDSRSANLLKPAHIYLINYENIKWLCEFLVTYFIEKGRPLPFDGVVWDEISKMKNSGTKRVSAVAKIIALLKWRTGLTGTPASNGLQDLHGQFLVVDRGLRLGVTKSEFQKKFMKKVGIYKDVPLPDAQDRIKEVVSDITIEMTAAEYLTLPKFMENDIEVELPPSSRIKYDQLEREFFAQLDSGQDVEVFNQASLTNKLLQVANGAVYPVAGMPLWEPMHDAKLDALEEILDEANGQPVFCAYAFRSDAARIMERFKEYDPINLTETKSERALNAAMDRWKAGDCRLMIAHPGSAGHGLDSLQHAGNILVWFGLNWSLELYDQFNARIMRQGQQRPVICHRIICQETMDEAVADALRSKATTQSSLRRAIRDYRKQRGM